MDDKLESVPLYIRNCPQSISERELYVIFGYIGTVKQIKKDYDSETNELIWKVDYTHKKFVDEAIEALQSHELLGHKLCLEKEFVSGRRKEESVGKGKQDTLDTYSAVIQQYNVVGLHFLDPQLLPSVDINLKKKIEENEREIVRLIREVESKSPLPTHGTLFLAPNCVILRAVPDSITRENIRAALGLIYRENIYAIERRCGGGDSRDFIMDLGCAQKACRLLQFQVLRGDGIHPFYTPLLPCNQADEAWALKEIDPFFSSPLISNKTPLEVPKESSQEGDKNRTNTKCSIESEKGTEAGLNDEKEESKVSDIDLKKIVSSEQLKESNKNQDAVTFFDHWHKKKKKEG